MVGSKVQHYQLLERLGAGGMGEIYRAQDTRLNRFVAIKVLTGTSSGDPDRRRRFIQEAQAASALNHPNIITIHDILSEGDAQFMVMEHVQGKTLADLIPRGGLRVPQVLKFGMQMTDALQAAHAAGIIHRDLKPGNVMVTETGLVKILDFGLAKLTDPAPMAQDDATRTIANAPLTVEGSIVGTVSYMSPEQAQGQKIDVRSDVFSLGVVLYEMITGNRAFQADTAVGTLTAILRDNPAPIQEVAPDVPPRLADVVERCLRKVPDDRFQTMRDVHMALGALKHESDSGVLYRTALGAAPAGSVAPSSTTATPVAAPQKSNMNIKIVGGIAAAVLLTGAIGWTLRPQTEPVADPEPPAAAAPQPEVMTNDSVIQMVSAKVPPNVIYSQIRNSSTNFVHTASEVTRMTLAGVPAEMIEAMRDPKNIPLSATAGAPPPKAPAPAAAPVTPKGGTAADAKSPDSKSKAAEPAAPPDIATAGAAPAIVPNAPAKGGATRPVVLTDASPFIIALDTDIPEDAKPGLPLRFHVVRDVVAGDAVVIAKGAQAEGEIVQGKRLFGKMTLRLSTVTAVDGKRYNIRALAVRGNKTPERNVETMKKPKGEKVAADAGTEYTAYADGDITVMVRGR